MYLQFSGSLSYQHFHTIIFPVIRGIGLDPATDGAGQRRHPSLPVHLVIGEEVELAQLGFGGLEDEAKLLALQLHLLDHVTMEMDHA